MKKILIISANFYPKISQLLLAGAIKKISDSGYEFETVDLPGVFEIPAAIGFAKDSKKYEGYIALGCVIRGKTTHYDYVCSESARGLNELAIKEKLAIGYGIITVENEAQALERADPAKKNKGGMAAAACLAMIELRKKFLIN